MRWLPEGRNWFCVWSFWCSELCSVDQTVTVHRGSVLDVRVQSDFSSALAHSGWVQFLERVGGGGGGVPMIHSAVQTNLRSLLRSGLVAEPVIDVHSILILFYHLQHNCTYNVFIFPCLSTYIYKCVFFYSHLIFVVCVNWKLMSQKNIFLW